MERKRSFQEYRFIHELGKGGFATVWKAYDTIYEKIVAIKQVKKSTVNMVRAIEEAKIHAQLKHEGIVEMEACFEDEEFFYFVLEYCSHGDLSRFLQMSNRATLTEPEAQSIIRQVLEALVYLQKHNIVHRDIKMANLLLNDEKRVKIGDFGLATKGSDPKASHMTFCGTPNFISPEMAAQMKHGVAVDIWGVGVLLYTLLVGQAPFANSTVKSSLNEVLSKDLYIPPEISREAEDLLRRLLEKNPTHRISVLDALKHPFFQLEEAPLQSPADVDSGIHSRSIFCLADDVVSSSRYSPSPHASIRSKGGGTVHASQSSINLRSAFLFNGYQATEPSSNFERENLYSRETPSVGNRVNHVEYSSYQTSSCGSSSRQNGDSRMNLQSRGNYSYQRGDSVADARARERSNQEIPVQKVPEQVVPFSTKRLRPTRIVTPVGVFYILSSGDAVLETNLRNGGSRYWIVTPDDYMLMFCGPPGASFPPPAPRDARYYRLSDLPHNWRPQFRKIATFVKSAQATTLKLTLNSDQASCRLMETCDDIIVQFATGEVVEKHGDHVTVESPYTSTTMHKFDLLEHEGERNAPIIVQFLKLHRECLQLEQMLRTQAPVGCEVFPACFGGRFRPNQRKEVNDGQFSGEHRAQSTPIHHPRYNSTTYE